MAKRPRFLTHPIEFVEPPITKEEALNPRHSPNGAWEPDGFDEANGGAAELPEDIYLDRVVYPHAEGPEEKAQRKRVYQRERDAEEYRAAALDRSRDFDITTGAVTGKSGPPSPFGDDDE